MEQFSVKLSSQFFASNYYVEPSFCNNSNTFCENRFQPPGSKTHIFARHNSSANKVFPCKTVSQQCVECSWLEKQYALISIVSV